MATIINFTNRAHTSIPTRHMARITTLAENWNG
jgi:hypothetical protein